MNRVIKKPNTHPTQSVPGNSMQQMWHVLTFHEKRITVLQEALKDSYKIIELLKKQNATILKKLDRLSSVPDPFKSKKSKVEMEISE
jgi:hypothetical protein